MIKLLTEVEETDPSEAEAEGNTETEVEETIVIEEEEIMQIEAETLEVETGVDIMRIIKRITSKWTIKRIIIKREETIKRAEEEVINNMQIR